MCTMTSRKHRNPSQRLTFITVYIIKLQSEFKEHNEEISNNFLPLQRFQSVHKHKK